MSKPFSILQACRDESLSVVDRRRFSFKVIPLVARCTFKNSVRSFGCAGQRCLAVSVAVAIGDRRSPRQCDRTPLQSRERDGGAICANGNDRQRLNQFLSQYAAMEAAAVPKAAGRVGPAAKASTTAIVRHSSLRNGMGVRFVPMGATDSASEASTTMSEKALGETSEGLRWERELGEALELARAGTYYQLLGVTSESPSKQIKRSFHALV